jgi:hypothetical protein
MQALESGSGVFYINGRPYALGSLEMRPFGESDTDVIIVYMPDGNVYSGRRPYTSFTIDGAAPADQAELLAWAAQYFSVCGGGSFNAKPVASGVSISGTAQVGQTLTLNYTRTDAEGDPAGTPIFKWYKNNVLISGATAQTYVPVTGDIGATIKGGVIVTSTAGSSPGVEVKSAATAAVIASGGGGLFAYWVANDDGHIPTEVEFLAGTAIPITHNQTTISYNITAQTTDRFVFLAEPIGEPEKTYKYASIPDQENLGPDGQFNVGVDLTTLRYYPSNAQTSNIDFPIQLKTSSDV